MGNNYLLESLAACHDSKYILVMYFTVNNAFTNCLNEFNLTEDVEIPIFTNKLTLEITFTFVIGPTNTKRVHRLV